MSENDTQTKELTPAQWRILPVMLSARTLEDAAKEGKISVRTLNRWLQEPHFQAAVSQAESSAIDYAVRRLLQLQDKAIDTITDVMDNALAPTSVRLRAAGMALETLIKLRELRNVEARLTALERLYAQP